MSIDDAISEVNTNIRPNPEKFSPLYREVAIALADEVERLRAECERLAVEKYEADDEAAACRAEIVNLNAELAAAKAASVCPVEVEEVCSLTPSKKPYDTIVATKTFGDMRRFRNWLRDRINERGEK